MHSVTRISDSLPAEVCRKWRESELFTKQEVVTAEQFLEHSLPVESCHHERLLGLPPSAMPWTSTCPCDGDDIWELWREDQYDLPFKLGAYLNWNHMRSQEPRRDSAWVSRSRERLHDIQRRVSWELKELGDWLGVLNHLDISPSVEEASGKHSVDEIVKLNVHR